jgi:peroxiredoxin
LYNLLFFRGKEHKSEEKVRMLADTDAQFTKALGLDLDLTGKLGGVRSKRFSAIINDGVVEQLNVEPESAPTGLTCSLAASLKL